MSEAPAPILPHLRNPLPPTIHASAVQIAGQGVLVRGPSGSGKSSLLLALLLADRTANRLVADDRVVLTTASGRLVAAPPPALAGLIEVRGQGILRHDHVPSAEIALVVDLEPAAECPRMPEVEEAFVEVAGVRIRRIRLPIGQADGWMRVMAAVLFAPAAI